MTWRRVGRSVLPQVLLVVGVLLLLLTTTARLTVLDRTFDNRVVAQTDAYERVYTEVLPAPATQKVIRAALADLPLDATYVTANLRLLVPPEVLEQVVNRALDGYVDAVLGGGDTLELLTVLQPLIEHVLALVHDLAPGLVAAGRPVNARTLAGFGDGIDRLLAQAQSGTLPLALPDLPLPARVSGGVAALLTAALPTDSPLRVQVEALLRSGDLNGALALVVPESLADDPGLASRLQENVSDLVEAAQRPVSASAGTTVNRSALPLGLRWLTAAGLVAVVAGVGVLVWWRRGAWRALAVGLGVAGGSALVVGQQLVDRWGEPLQRLVRSTDLPPTALAVVRDVDAGLRNGVTATYLRLVTVVLVAALASAFVAWTRREARSQRRFDAAPSLACAGLATALLLALLRPPTAPPATCNSAQQLCTRTYDQVTYLTSHNAMASSDEGFFSANQDVDLVRQLDGGVRGLMLDLHTWTTPTEVSDYLSQLSPEARAALAPLAGALEPREGLWLCHIVCQLGAREAVTELKRVRDWMRTHRDAVVTLIIEDHVDAAQTQSVLEDSGLDAFAATPPTLGAPWPTLGDMVRTGKRLVTFTERAHSDQGWLRNLYDYAAETPYEATSAKALSCRPGRGPVTGSLFLLNNWVSTPAPSRAEAYAINRKAALLSRAQKCAQVRGMHPTFVAVDFAQIGQPLDAVNRLNR